MHDGDNEIQQLKQKIGSTAAQYIPEYNPRFRLNDINMSDLVVEQPVMTLRAQKSQRNITPPSNIRAQLMQNFQNNFVQREDE